MELSEGHIRRIELNIERYENNIFTVSKYKFGMDSVFILIYSGRIATEWWRKDTYPCASTTLTGRWGCIACDFIGEIFWWQHRNWRDCEHWPNQWRKVENFSFLNTKLIHPHSPTPPNPRPPPNPARATQKSSKTNI